MRIAFFQYAALAASTATLVLTTPGQCEAPQQTGNRKATRQNYFPEGVITKYEQEWYGKCLTAMREPVLSPAGKPADYIALRIVYIPSWGHAAAIRYEKKGERFFRRAVMLSDQGSSNSTKITVARESEVKKSVVDDLIASLDKAGFGSMRKREIYDLGKDGEQVIVELIRKGTYRARVRWTPRCDMKERGLTAFVGLYTSEFQKAGLWKKKGDGTGLKMTPS
jgi:hypothetical protein